MLKMMVYLEANTILGSSLSPNNRCICKKTAIQNHAVASLLASFADNRLVPASAVIKISYTVLFQDWDGTVLKTETVSYGGTATPPSNPSRTGYTFTGWSPSDMHPSADTIYTAQYSQNSYSIRFLDYDGTVLKTETVTHGSNPTPPANPTRSGYTFSGWSPAVGAATQNQDYTATYTQDVQQNTYTIVFAERRSYSPGIYFVMNDDSVVPISDSGSISAANVKGVAYLAANGQDSYLIDTVDSGEISFGYPNVSSYGEADYIYLQYSYHGDAMTTALKQAQNPSSPMPSITFCNNRGNDWYIPTTSEWYEISRNLGAINLALAFLNGDLILFNVDMYYAGGGNEYYPTANTSYPYWTCTYEDNSLNSLSVICNILLTTRYNPQYDSEAGHMVYDERVSYEYNGFYLSSSQTARLRLVKHINVTCPIVAGGTIYQTMTVAEGVTPNPNTPSQEGYVFGGWTPTLYPANKNEVYAADWYEELTPGNPYAIFCEGVASGGTVYVDVHTTSLSISWTGPTPIDNQWDVSGSGPGQAQAGYHSWGSGYLNNLNFTSTVTIQNGASVGYTVYAVHPSAGESTSIGGSWEVRVVESH